MLRCIKLREHRSLLCSNPQLHLSHYLLITIKRNCLQRPLNGRCHLLRQPMFPPSERFSTRGKEWNFPLWLPCHIVHHSYCLAFQFETSTPGSLNYFNARGTACALDTVHDVVCMYLSSHTGQQITFVERESLPAPFRMYCPTLCSFCVNIERLVLLFALLWYTDSVTA